MWCGVITFWFNLLRWLMNLWFTAGVGVWWLRQMFEVFGDLPWSKVNHRCWQSMGHSSKWACYILGDHVTADSGTIHTASFVRRPQCQVLPMVLVAVTVSETRYYDEKCWSSCEVSSMTRCIDCYRKTGWLLLAQEEALALLPIWLAYEKVSSGVQYHSGCFCI